MTGSLQIKNGKYYVVLNQVFDGRRKQKWVNTGLCKGCKKRDLEKKYREIIAAYESPAEIQKSQILFSDYIMIWLNEIKIKVDEVTFQHYKDDIKRHIFPFFSKSGVKLVDVDRQILQHYINEKADHGRLDGNGGLSAKTIRHHKNIIHQVLELALDNGLIRSNPSSKLTLPKVERNTYDFYNREELNAFLTAVKDEPLFPLYYVTAVLGLRRSEVLGLKWDSIDFEQKKLTIKHTRTKCNTIIEKDKTKTKSSLRSFPLTDKLNDLFIKLKNQEKTNKSLYGSAYEKNDYVFKWDDGRKYDSDYITSRFSKDLKKHGLRHIAFHGLRHSCGSLLNEQGFTLKDIQEWLGHSDIQTTANIYLHLDTKRKENIANNLAASIEI